MRRLLKYFWTSMYFKYSGRRNPNTNRNEPYLRLVESYRNAEGRVCHRTVLNIGFPEEEVTAEQLNQIARHLNNRYERKASLFVEPDELVNRWTDHLWNRIVQENRLDLELYSPKSRKIDPDTMWHSDVREFGSDRMGYQLFQELKIDEVLARQGFPSRADPAGADSDY